MLKGGARRDAGRVAARRGPTSAEVLAALILVGAVVVSVASALHNGWVPIGDDAVVVARSGDVLHGPRPLVGMPTSLHQYTGEHSHHPGPLLFAWLAPFVTVGGRVAGGAVGVATLHVLAVLAAAWAAHRVAGPRLALVAGGAGVLVATRTAPLFHPINSAIGPTLTFAVLVLAWAVLAGRSRAALPLLALASLMAQAHLPYALVVAPVAAAALAVDVVRRARRARPAGGRGVARALAPLTAATAALWVVPVLEPSHNLLGLARAAVSSDIPSRGVEVAPGAVVHALGPGVLLGLDGAFSGSVGPAPLLAAGAVVAALAWGWRRRDPVVRPGVVVLGLALLGTGGGAARMPPSPVEPLQAGWMRSVALFALVLALVAVRPLWRGQRSAPWFSGGGAWAVARGVLAAPVAAVLVAMVVAPGPRVGTPLSYEALPHRAAAVLADALDAEGVDGPLGFVQRGGEVPERALFGAVAERLEDGDPALLSSYWYWDLDRWLRLGGPRPEALVLVAAAPVVGPLPAGWSLLAEVAPPEPAARAEAVADVAAFVAGAGSVALTEEGRAQLPVAVDGLLPTACEDLDRWAAAPEDLAAAAPEALFELYRRDLVASPSLPPDLARRVDRDHWGPGVWAYRLPPGGDPLLWERTDRLVLSRVGC